MYYRLKEPWAFRGWKKLPFALCAMQGEHRHDEPMFMEKEPFLELLSCNGEEDVDIAALSEATRRIITGLVEGGVLEQSDTPLPPLAAFQHYHIYPSKRLRSAHWSITGKCNYNCRHCLLSASDVSQPQLSLEECLHIVDEIAICGINRVDITGGEPLLRQDFEQIVQSLSKHGIPIGVLFTNGSLVTADTLDMLERNHQHPAFQISFDGLGYHDWLRNVPGSEKRADKAFRLIKERGFQAYAAMCIHKKNKDSLRDTVNYLAGVGVEKIKVNAPQYLGTWKEYAGEYALSDDEIWEVYREYIPYYFSDGMPVTIELDGYFHCEKGKKDYKIPFVHKGAKAEDLSECPYCESVCYNIYITSDGRLTPCMGFSETALKDRFPSILEHPLADLTLDSYWNDVVQTKVSELVRKNPECAACAYLTECRGGCMVDGITDEGDYLVPDPHCCYFHRHIGETSVRDIADAAIVKSSNNSKRS